MGKSDSSKKKKEQNYHMIIQGFHFGLCGDIQKDQQQGLQQMFVHHVHSSVIHNGQKNRSKPISTMDERINKIWSTHLMEYYASMKESIHSETCYHRDKPCGHFAR